MRGVRIPIATFARPIKHCTAPVTRRSDLASTNWKISQLYGNKNEHPEVVIINPQMYVTVLVLVSSKILQKLIV